MARLLSLESLAEDRDAGSRLLPRLTHNGLLQPTLDDGHVAGGVIRVEAAAAFLRAGDPVPIPAADPEGAG